VFNTGHGSWFTAEAFTGVLKQRGIAISMDGMGAWRGNVFIERLWHTVKYGAYLRAYASVSEARESLTRCFEFRNESRPHQSLDGRTPDEACINLQQLPAAA
jgi:putative transposase